MGNVGLKNVTCTAPVPTRSDASLQKCQALPFGQTRISLPPDLRSG